MGAFCFLFNFTKQMHNCIPCYRTAANQWDWNEMGTSCRRVMTGKDGDWCVKKRR